MSKKEINLPDGQKAWISWEESETIHDFQKAQKAKWVEDQREEAKNRPESLLAFVVNMHDLENHEKDTPAQKPEE